MNEWLPSLFTHRLHIVSGQWLLVNPIDELAFRVGGAGAPHCGPRLECHCEILREILAPVGGLLPFKVFLERPVDTDSTWHEDVRLTDARQIAWPNLLLRQTSGFLGNRMR